MASPSDRLPEKSRTLIVHKDDGGYGLTLSGDKPTRVQTVKQGGASFRAGVREGDVIIKVNGQQVTESSHTDVVQLIQTGSYVALTVVHSSRFTALNPTGFRGSARDVRDLLLTGEPTGPGPGAETPGLGSRRESYRAGNSSITGPTAANNDAEKKLFTDKMYTIQLMVEQQNRLVEELKSNLARNNSKKTRTKLEVAVRNLAELETQASQLRQAGSPDKSGDQTVLRLGPVPVPSSAPTSPMSPISAPVAPPRSESMGAQGFSGMLTSPLTPTTGLPPPLPARNKADYASTTAPLPPPRNSGDILPPGRPHFPRYNSHENLQTKGDPPLPQRRGSTVQPPSPSSPQTNKSESRVYHARTRSSPVPLEQTLEVGRNIDFLGGRKSPRYETPPGTPPPPYNLQSALCASAEPHLVTWGGLLDGVKPDIITMEDDSDTGEEEGAVFNNTAPPPEGDHGPFNSLPELLQHSAHLAVFLNYVISNSDPSPLLFYLVTDAYKSGSAKEMRKWAYEIHSCFLVPKAPLELSPNLEPSVIQHIDKFLAEEQAEPREESLLKLFWKVRSKARDILKLQLDDFRAKRAAGLGNIFGPADPELRQCDDNEVKKMAVINDRLVPMLETMSEDLENATDRNATLCASLATVLSKIFNTKCPKALGIIEKMPTFVSKEKKREKFLGRVLKKQEKVQGHNFGLRHYDQVTYCNQSQSIIWGIGPQGYQCSNCGFDVFRKFVHKVEESCVGPSNNKKQGRKSILPLGITSRLSGSLQVLEPGKGKGPSVSPSPSIRGPADLQSNSSFKSYASNLSETEPDGLETRLGSQEPEGAGGRVAGGVSSPGQEASFRLSGGETPVRSPSSISDHTGEGGGRGAGVGVKRSESAKADGEGARRAVLRREDRKRSNPDLGSKARHSLDAETVSKSGSSSSSSIAEIRLWEATSTVLQNNGASGGLPRADSRADSDLEAEPSDPPDWRNSLSQEELSKMRPGEQKRQDVINELFCTERSHVRNLKVLDTVFRKPLLESGLMPKEVVDRLFPNIEEVLVVHQSYNNAMKHLAKDGYPISCVGELLADMFLGSYGDRLIQVGAEFTKNQKFTLEELKRIRSRDSRVEARLAEMESNPVCRRLGLKSLLPVEHQRLVKYPLLLEQISKYCDEELDRNEFDLVREATSRTKEILDSIDKQVAEAQNKRKLEDVQRNLDTSGLEKMGTDNGVFQEYRNIDLTRLRLHYDGVLTLNLGGSGGGDSRRSKTIELHVLLLEDCVMFLQRQDEKYLLKFHTGSTSIVQSSSREDAKKIHSPVIKFNTMLVRPVATNKRAFYLMNTTQVGAQLYELVASSTSERSTWLSHISQASAAYKSKEVRRDFRPTNSMSNMTFVSTRQQMFETPTDPPDRNRNIGTGRSHSFNEQSLRQREAILNRPLPSPPPPQSLVERSHSESIEKKIEKLSKKDEEVAKALEEKQKIIADIFNIPPEDYDAISDLVVEDDRSRGKEAKEVLLAVMSQADNLARCVNDCLKVEEGVTPSQREGEGVVRLASPPSDKLVTLTTSMNTNLTALLAIIQEQEEEKQRWRRELLQSQEQVRAFVTGSDHSFRSRPDSFISLESDGLNSENETTENEKVGESVENGRSDAMPSSSTPLKDATPTNEVPSDDEEDLSIQNGDSNEDNIDAVAHEAVPAINAIEDLGEIVESSDC